MFQYRTCSGRSDSRMSASSASKRTAIAAALAAGLATAAASHALDHHVARLADDVVAGDRGPSRDWLTLVRTTRARNKIKQWFRAESREDTEHTGRQLLQEHLAKAGLPAQKITGSALLADVIRAGALKADKRDKLISALLARPEFVDYWTYKWSDILMLNGTLLPAMSGNRSFRAASYISFAQSQR